jgi:serine/threonine protein kinase
VRHLIVNGLGFVEGTQRHQLHMSDSNPASSNRSGGSSRREEDAQEAYPTEDGSNQMLFRRYKVLRELGRGGMGVVVLAQDTALDIPVAVKLVPDIVVKDTESVTDLRKEVLRGMALLHTGIVRTHNFEKDEGGAAIIMEYVDGDNLSDLKMRQPGYCFDPEQILPWIEQLCSALDYAHGEARIVHRDLKPRNLILSKSGKLKIADFGIAAIITDSVSRHSMEGNVSGTLSYMSPQQAEGKRPTILDDVHAVGATIYELLTGKPPFFRGSPVVIQTQVITMVPPSMAERREELEVTGHAPISAIWEETVAACLAKDPAMRPQSAMEVISRLKAAPRAASAVPVETVARAHVPEPVVKPPPLPPARATVQSQLEETRVVIPAQSPSRGPKLWPVAGIILMATAGVAIWWFGRDKGPGRTVTDSTKIAVIDKSGKDDASLKIDQKNVARSTVRLGLPVQYIFKRNGGSRFICRGFLDGDGKIDPRPLDQKWKYVTPFYGNLLNVEQDGKWGMVDDSGKIVHEPQWDDEPILTSPGLFNYSPDFAYIQRSGKFGLIHRSGKVISQPQWEDCYGVSEGLAAVVRNGKWGFIDTNGTVVIDLVWTTARPFSDGLAAVSRDGKAGYIDKTGTVVIPLEWDTALPFTEELAAVKRGEKTGYINKPGKVVIPVGMDDKGIFGEGLAPARRGEKWGYIDKSGSDRIRPKFDYAEQFIAGLATVQVKGKWGLIDRSGNFVLQPRFDRINRLASGESVILNGKKMGVLDRNGREILAPDWDEAYVGDLPGGDLPKGYLAAARRVTDTKTLMMIFDLQGRKIWEGSVPVIDENAPHPNGPRVHRVPENFGTIAKALAQAFPGDTIEVGPGTYNESLRLVSGVRLIGAGAEKTTIRADAKQSVIFVNECAYGLISDLTLEHVGSDNSETRYSVLLLAKSKVEVLRCQIRNSVGNGVTFSKGDRSSLTRCTVTGSGWNGIMADEAETAPAMRQNRVIGNAKNGIFFGNRSGGLAEENTVESNGFDGILVSGANTKPELRANVCRVNSKNGVEYYQGAGGLADANRCEQNKWAGIAVAGTGTAPALTNNRCNNNGNSGIAIEKRCVPTAFSGNTAAGNKFKTQIDRAAVFE